MGIKYPVNENFFKVWSPEMAYVLGYIYADGSLINDVTSRGKYVTITSTDPEIIPKIKKCLASKHRVIEVDSVHPNGKVRFVLRIGNAKLYSSLVDIGLYPNKSLTITMPRIPNDLLGNFVRGYFDGDGCVHLEHTKTKAGKPTIKRLLVVFTSGSKVFLQELFEALKNELQIDKGSLYKSQRAFQLRFSTSVSIRLFKFMYHDPSENLYLERKFNIFAEYFDFIPKKVDKKVSNILQSLR